MVIYHYDNTGTTRPLEKSVCRDWKALENQRSVGKSTNIFQPKRKSSRDKMKVIRDETHQSRDEITHVNEACSKHSLDLE